MSSRAKPSGSVEKIEYGGEPPNQNGVSQPAAPLPLASTLGNPTPAYVFRLRASARKANVDDFHSGMFAFSGTMLLMALYNLGAGGVTVSNVLVGMLVFAGGIAQALVAMWELARGNTLFATCTLDPRYSCSH